jgi:hypothetical protein
MIMGERPKGPMDPGWRPADPVGQALMLDILQRLQQHSAEDTLPRSPRGLFYDLRPGGMGNGLTYTKQPRMVQVGGSRRRADPAEIGPVQVQEMLVKLRRAGLVPEDWIEDTRAPEPDAPYYSNATAEDRVASLLSQIRNPLITWDPQIGQECYIELAVEAAGLVGRIARIAGPYGVPVYSGGGFDGLKGKRGVAERAAGREVPTVVLRISDYDTHGLRIAEAAAADSSAWSEREHGMPWDWLEFERIALTEDQAADAGVLDDDGKAEADALPVPVMDAIVRDAIEARQDPDQRRANQERAREETGRVTGLVLAALSEDGE